MARARNDILQGTLALLVLRTLSVAGPLHGYAITSHIQRVSAELLRVDAHHTWGNFFDVLKLLVYAAWFTAAWRSAGKTENSPARLAGRLAVAAGVVTAALTV